MDWGELGLGRLRARLSGPDEKKKRKRPVIPRKVQ